MKARLITKKKLAIIHEIKLLPGIRNPKEHVPAIEEMLLMSTEDSLVLNSQVGEGLNIRISKRTPEVIDM